MKQLPIVLFKAFFLRRLKYKKTLSVSISTILPPHHHIGTKVMWHIFFCSRHGREDLKIACTFFLFLSFWFAFLSLLIFSVLLLKTEFHLYLWYYYTLSECTKMTCERGFGSQIPCFLHPSTEDQWFQEFLLLCYMQYRHQKL